MDEAFCKLLHLKNGRCQNNLNPLIRLWLQVILLNWKPLLFAFFQEEAPKLLPFQLIELCC